MVAASRTTATDETLAISGKVFEDGSCVETYQPTKSNMEPQTFPGLQVNIFRFASVR